MTKSTPRTLLTFTAALGLFLSGCANPNPDADISAPTGQSSGTNNVLRYALWSNPNGIFNPITYRTNYDQAINYAIYSRLVVRNKDREFVPELAESYEYSEDGTTLTFKLRDGITWHDGEPFTADDVAFSYAAAADPGLPIDTPAFVQNRVGFADYNSGKSDTLEGIKVIDEHTISFTFQAPYLGALAYLAHKPVLAKHVWEGTPVSEWNNATALLQNPIGTGPFKFKEFASDQYVSLDANPDYFKGAPKLDSLIFVVSNAETAQTELLNGNLDVVELSSWNPQDLDVYEKGGASILEQDGQTGQYLTLDTKNPKFADPLVRQAFVYGIDRQGIIDSLLYGHGATFNTNADPNDPFYPTDLNTYAYDPTKATELLAQAGWKDSDGDGTLDKDGEPFTFELNFPTGNKTRELSAPIIQSNLEALGIDVTLTSADFNSTLAILQDSERRYDGVLMGGDIRTGLYDNNHWWQRYDDAHLNELAHRFESTGDQKQYQEYVGDWLREINDIALQVWLYIPNSGFALSPRVQNFAPAPLEPLEGAEQWTVTD